MRFLSALLLIPFFTCGCSPQSPESAPTEENSVQLHPDFPIVEGLYQMTREWSVHLPSEFNRRIEDESLVIWKPGITIWTNVWGDDGKFNSSQERVEWLKKESPPAAFDSISEITDGVTRYSYRLQEGPDQGATAAFYCFAIGRPGHVQMAIYFDDPEHVTTALQIWRSLSPLTP